MRPRILGPLCVALLCATAALAQVNYEPTPPPDTAANDRSWYRDGDPIPFAGDLYYQAGPTVHFDGYTMVPTGSYDGVTLYADTTLEPYSVVLLPVGDDLLRPYERLRAGDLAGTTGSRTPRFPVQISPYTRPPQAQAERQPSRREGRRAVRPPMPPPEEPEMNQPPEEPRGGLLVQTARRPMDNIGMWVSFQGYRWEQAGEAMTLDATKLTRVGEYYRLPVYADARTPYVIYIPVRDNLVAPFKRSGS